MKIRSLIAVGLFASYAFTAQAANWTGYTYSAVSTTAAVKGMHRISEGVEKATNGDLKIKIHLGKTLQIKSSDITQSVGDGVVQFAADYFFSGSVPIARVLNLPLLIENDEEWAKAYAAMKPTLEAAFAKQGVVLLGSYRYPKQVIFTTFPMHSLSDLKGHKVRVTSPEQGQFISEFGGAPITLAGSEVPTSLERRVIEGVLTASAGGAKNWHEFLPHNYRFPVNYGNSMVIANAKAFSSLPASQQKAVRKIVAEEVEKISSDFNADEKVQMDFQAGKGMKIQSAGKADFAEASKRLKPYWASWAKKNGPEYEAALTKVRSALGK
jgi:TRAP-type C4-dicarboxylate transport system substrate-binding protein